MGAPPITGAWAQKFQVQVPYTDARRWGSGINPVHAYRGDTGRPQNSKLNANALAGDRTPANWDGADPGFVENGPPWGYNPEDIAGLDVYGDESAATFGIPFEKDGWPSWEGGEQDYQSTPVNRATVKPGQSRPWGAPQWVYERLRSMRAGAYDSDRWVSNQQPTETVSEGWINKAASGMDDGTYPDDFVLTPDESQLWVNTSLVQRNKELVNDRAVARGQDEARSSIPSRFAPMKLKVYSGEERHYDMFPYQQDDIPRPFYYRTAGTGPQEYTRANDQRVRVAMQRNPPPDPSMGIVSSEQSQDTGDYGYNSEDTGYF